MSTQYNTLRVMTKSFRSSNFTCSHNQTHVPDVSHGQVDTLNNAEKALVTYRIVYHECFVALLFEISGRGLVRTLILNL